MMARRLLGRFVAGLLLGAAVAFFCGPRFWHVAKLETALHFAVGAQDDAAARRLVPRFVALNRWQPLRVIAFGNSLRLLGNGALLDALAAAVLDRYEPTSELSAQAYLWRGYAALPGDPAAARRWFEEVMERYRDYRQADEAEAELGRLDSQSRMAALDAARAAAQWAAIVTMTADYRAVAFNADERDNAFVARFAALLHLGQGPEAVAEFLAAVAGEDPVDAAAALRPSNYLHAPGAPAVLAAIAARLPADHPQRADLLAAQAAMAGDTSRLAALMPQVAPAMVLDLLGVVSPTAPDERAFDAAFLNVRLDDAQRRQVWIALARRRLHAGDWPGVRDAIAHARETAVEGGAADAELEILALRAEGLDASATAAGLEKLASRWAPDEALMASALGEAQHVLGDAGRRAEACDLAHRNLTRFADEARRQALLQFCSSP